MLLTKGPKLRHTLQPKPIIDQANENEEIWRVVIFESISVGCEALLQCRVMVHEPQPVPFGRRGAVTVSKTKPN